MKNYVQKMEQWLERQNIGKCTEKIGIIAGISGGADSVCLLRLLTACKDVYTLEITAVHVHHGIRGEEADRDMVFVQQLCESLRVPLVIEKRDVPALAEDMHMTLEEAGRQVRYEVFERVRVEKGADWIAVAHHKDDQAETVLMNLFRGSALTGMGGMRPVQGYLIRPLLDMSRKEIECCLREMNQCWCQDSTNLEPDTARNMVRLQVLPLVQTIWPETVETLNQSAERFAAAASFLRSQAETVLEEQEENALSVSRILALHPALRDEVLYLALTKVTGRKKDLTARHVAQLVQLCAGQSGRQIQMPYGVTVFRSYDRLIFQKGKLPVEERMLPQVRMQVISRDDAEKIKENDYTKCFAYDRIECLPVLRFRQSGDWIALYADGRGKKLQDFFTDRKIPAAERDHIPVLALGDEVLWVVGHRVSERIRVKKNTEQVLVVTLSQV